MAFRKIETLIKDLWVIEADVFRDPRGWFKETYNEFSFRDLGFDLHFVQDNLSYSTKGILRGLHFQGPPFAQGKLVSVIKGEVLDVAVDIRKGSATYGKWHAELLTDENQKMLYVPPGFAHGFAVYSEDCLFQYKVTGKYNKESEGGIRWNDPDIGIDWKLNEPVISEKDEVLPMFRDFDSPFES